MKIRTTILALFAMASIFGGGYALAPATHAAGVYHVVTSKAVSNVPYHWNGTSTKAYLWNSNLTTKQHHLTNYPKTTWYATKKLKMTNWHKTGIFYYVTNGNGTISGTVWRDYLSSGIPKGSNGVPTNIDTEDYEASLTKKQDKPLYKLFPGTSSTDALFEEAQDYAGGSGYSQVTKNELGNKLKDVKHITLSTQPTSEQQQALLNGTLSFTNFVSKDLKSQGITPKQYEGWQIGIYSSPIYKGDQSEIGKYVISLLPPQH